MDETKIEQVEATPEVETKVEETAEVEKAEAVEPTEAEEVVEAPVEEVVEAPAEEAPVVEGCEGEKCDSCKTKKEDEDDQEEKKVAVKEGLQNEHEARQRKEVAKEQAKDVMEHIEDVAAEKVADLVMEALENMPIEEGVSEEEYLERKQQIMENGKILLADIYNVLEEVLAGSTVELTGHQVEVKDFVGKGGKVGMSLPAGINPPCKEEDDEDEKKVHIKAYHESAEEIDYKAKYAESEATLDDLVTMVEETASKYTELVEKYNTVVEELQAYKISEAYSITVDDATDLLKDYSFDEVCEALDEYEANESNISEGCEDKEEKPEEKEDKEEKAEEKEEEKKEKEQEKAMEEIKESADVEGAIISENEVAPKKNRAYSVFAKSEISESKRPRKAFSVFAD